MQTGQNCSVYILVGVTEDEESTGFGHGNSLLLQLNVRKRPGSWTHGHLWLVIVIVS